VLLAWVVSQLLVAPGQDGPLPWVPASRLPRALVFPSMAFGLLPVGWSLYVEMAMSIVFPLLLVLGARIHPVAPLALSFAFLGELDPRFGFLRFTIDFALGMWLRLEAARVSAAFGRLPGWAPATAAVLGLALLQVPYLPGFASTGFAGLERGHTPAAVVVLALGSALLVAGTLHSKGWSRALSTPLARLYGRISYSFYLVHHTVLMVFVLHAPGHVFSWPTALGVTALAFAATSLLGELGWRAVELPAIRAGRALVGAAQAWVRPRPAS
jgi:peptidoglycan/LPS O-acetylase OafA/YrhL